MQCRKGCGACCIAPSINQPFFGMPDGKKAGMRCVHLSNENLCQLFGDPRRPQCCESFTAELDFCGESFEQALDILRLLEAATF
jgi:hypothetical protein